MNLAACLFVAHQLTSLGCSLFCFKLFDLRSSFTLKPDLHEPQPPVEWSVTLIFSVVVE